MEDEEERKKYSGDEDEVNDEFGDDEEEEESCIVLDGIESKICDEDRDLLKRCAGVISMDGHEEWKRLVSDLQAMLNQTQVERI